VSYHQKYCDECGTPLAFTKERRRWELGMKVLVTRNARKKNEKAGLLWTPEMNVLLWRRGTVKEIVMGAVVVEFIDTFAPNRKKPLLTGLFKFSPDALEHAVESYDRATAARKRNAQRMANSKAWYAAWTKGLADRERGAYSNPFDGEQFKNMLELWMEKIPYIQAKHELNETPGLRKIWTSIRKFDLANEKNEWLVEILADAYDKAWKQMEEKMKAKFFSESLVLLLRENSLRLNAGLLRAMEADDVETFKNIDSLKETVRKYGYDIL
jgi:hypothetical protein